MFQQEPLEQIIQDLILQKSEGDFWDFKREWHEDSKNADLVKDIICFANSIHQQDCYLIFGVDNSFNIVGMEKKRRTQADIIDLLSNIQWAGDNIPHISVKAVILENILLDILVIHNTSDVPYYLKKDYQNGKHCVRQGVIYSREKDRNTAWDAIASPLTSEKLWKKRFHLHEPIIEQIYHLLAYTNEWDAAPDNVLYHRYRPEFSISEKSSNEGTVYEEFFVEYMPDSRAFSHIYQLKYNENTLRDIYVLYLDGCRFITPYPKVEINHSISESRYFYMVQNSIDWYLQLIFNKDSGYNHNFSQEIFFDHIVLFESEDEKNMFSDWCYIKQKIVKDSKSEIIIQHTFERESFEKDAYSTELAKALLQKYRATKTMADMRNGN